MIKTLIGKFKLKDHELKLKVGSVYQNREGEIVKIVSERAWHERHALNGYEFEGSDGQSYLRNGQYFKDMPGHRKDLIAQVN